MSLFLFILNVENAKQDLHNGSIHSADRFV